MWNYMKNVLQKFNKQYLYIYIQNYAPQHTFFNYITRKSLTTLQITLIKNTKYKIIRSKRVNKII